VAAFLGHPLADGPIACCFGPGNPERSYGPSALLSLIAAMAARFYTNRESLDAAG